MRPEPMGVQRDAAPPVFREVPLEHHTVVLSFFFLPAYGISAVNEVNLYPGESDLKACVYSDSTVAGPK